MAILTRQSASDLLNRADILDPDTFGSAYLDGIFSAVDGAISSYLHWNPALTIHADEEGAAQYVQSGTYAGRYFVELHNQPLVPGEAANIFTKFQLRYPITTPTGADVSLDFVKVFHATGQVFCLAPGAVEALSAVMFGFAPVMNRVTAVEYVASYASGYAVGNGSDPLDPTTSAAFTGVPPLPAPFRDAAVLLVRERLAYDAALNKNPANPNAGLVYRVRVGEREEAYRAFGKVTTQSSLGLGTPLSVSAEALLKPYRKRHAPFFL